MSTEPQFQPIPRAEDFAVPNENPNFDEGVVTDFIESIPEVVKESKTGLKTTEFWLTIVTSVLVVLNGIPLPEKYEGFVVTALGIAYAISRGLAKKGVPNIEVSPPAA